MANKRLSEVDARLLKIVKEVYADFKRYLPMPQDKHVFERKQREYENKIIARMKEEMSDGRTADDTAGV